MVKVPDVGLTTLPIGHRCAADAAVDRGVDLGIVEIDLCRLELCLRRLQLRRRDALRCLRVVNGLLGTGIFLHELLLAPELDVAVLELRLGLRDRRLLDVDGRLKRRALERVEQVALLDVGTFREKLLVQEGGDARYDVDAVDRLNTAVEFVAVGHRPTFHLDHSDRGGSGRRRLCHRTRGGQYNSQERRSNQQ